jgi:chromosome segregation ATPase
MTNRKIEALQEAAAEKARESAQRVEKALGKMIKQGQIITFKSVAHVANVSTAYLYKQADLRNRIETLRDQQKNSSKPKQSPPASDNSKAVIIYNLRAENKKLRTEIDELRRINESLTGRLYQLQNTNNLAERLRTENESLQQQVKELVHSLAECESKLPQKVTPISKAKRKSSDIPESIKTRLESLGVKQNATLVKVINSTSELEVLTALDAVEQYARANDVSNTGGLVVDAIKQKWEPSAPLKAANVVSSAQPQESDFSRWFEAAQKKGIVLASQLNRDTKEIILYLRDGSTATYTQMKQQYPLENLTL